jgi:hypothetical protein
MAKANVIAQNSMTQKPNAYISGLIGYDSADYGGGFLNYTPPTPDGDFDIRIAIDTNATTPGKRLYVYAGGSWHYVDLTG